MADPRATMLDIIEGKKPMICDEDCKYFRFPHQVVACVLSEVFSVAKGQMCYIKKLKHPDSDHK